MGRAIDQAQDGDCLISITYGDPMGLSIAGDFGFASAWHLREALDVCIEDSPTTLRLEGRGIGTISMPGLVAIGEAMTACRDRGTEVQLELSEPARRFLDAIDLRWLGVDGRPPLEDAIKEARTADASPPHLDATPGPQARDERGDHG